MGADYIEMEFNGKMTKDALISAVVKHIQESKRAKSMDPDYDGYSGSWAEVDSSCIVSDKVFSDYKDAAAYIGDSAEKWGSALAVKVIKNKSSFKSNNDRDNFEKEKLEALKENKKLIRIMNEYQEHQEDFKKIAEEILEIKLDFNKLIAESEREFFKCKECKSTVAKKFIKTRSDLVPIKLLYDAKIDDPNEYLKGYKESNIPKCPLCDDILVSDTKIKSLDKKFERLKSITEELLRVKKDILNKKKEIEADVLNKFSKKIINEETSFWLVGAWASS